MSDVQDKQQLKEQWERYRESELARVTPMLRERGIVLDEVQVHIGGERYLMSGRKLVLTGSRSSDGKRVIVKVSSDANGVAEIEQERNARAALQKLDFSYRRFLCPTELLHLRADDLVIVVIEFIAEDQSLLKHEPIEQFFLSLRALETQEGVQVATAAHVRAVRGVFGTARAADYLVELEALVARITSLVPSDEGMKSVLARASAFCESHREIIDRYGDFLTHTDFVPHNLRTVGNDIYLLDYASIRFANKYESWARFLNYMVIHQPRLERWLVQYVKANRPLEYPSLQAMRVFKIVYLIDFYVRSLGKTSGDLHALNEERIRFWMSVLTCVLDDQPVSDELIQTYVSIRDRLRSEEERLRQQAIT